MNEHLPPEECRLEKDDPLRMLLEATVTTTGERFFEALVENLARALSTKHAWITEYIPDLRRLRALAFWVDGELIPDFEVDIDGTPCEAVIDTAQLVLYPDNIRDLFPASSKLRELGAVSYMGVPLMDLNGAILGHLAVIDDRPMPEEASRLVLFKIFAARASAELQRIRAESEIKEREEKLRHLVAGAMDAIIELNKLFDIVMLNPAAEMLLNFRLSEIGDHNFCRFLSAVDWVLKREIRIEWNGPRRFTVHVDGDYPIRWEVSLGSGAGSRAMNWAAAWIPDRWWRNRRLLDAFGKAGGLLMGSGRINLTGTVPNGQRFTTNPKIIWPVASSRASVCGRQLGPTGPLPVQAHLADVWLPQNGRFFAGNVYMEPFDPARHNSALSRSTDNTRENLCWA